MLGRITSFILTRWTYFISSIFVKRRQLDSSQNYVLLVNEAKKEWYWTNNLMQEVKDTNLIDQAIYFQSAAERKYVHLLQQAAREGIKADLETIVFLALVHRNQDIRGVSTCRQNYGQFY